VNEGSDWKPAAPLSALALRAQQLARIRDFFAQQDVLEVETPLLSAAGATDPQLDSFVTRYTGPGAAHGQPLYLHTSPEFAMKRLLAAGSGAIFQICKVFRNGEAGRLHNPEFTLLEWYRPGFDHHRLMDEVDALVRHALAPWRELGAAERLTYREAFERHAGIDPHAADRRALAACATTHGLHAPAADLSLDGWRDLLLTHLVEPHLGQRGPTFLYDYPASQAALARVRPGAPALAERFELYIDGVELANGYHELGDARAQRTRFEADLALRQATGRDLVAMDERLLAALTGGLPDCAGVALGVDRLLMLAARARSIKEVLAFPLARA
jgi:lysyl-tRNA synthetase class 2